MEPFLLVSFKWAVLRGSGHVENGGQVNWGTRYFDSSDVFIQNVEFVGMMSVEKWLKRRAGQGEI